MTPLSPQIPTGTRPPLADALVKLAQTPDDVSSIAEDLQKVAELAATRISKIDYAAVSPQSEDGPCTVAVSQDLAVAVQDAAVADLDAVAPPLEQDVSGHGGADASVTLAWPGFREAATSMGMRVVSMPLFTGSGATRATLDLCSRDAAAMAPLTAGICAAYDPNLPSPGEVDDLAPLDDGGQELVAGFAEALSVRATIQLAVELVATRSGSGPNDAYLELRLDAADKGISLLAAATAVITRSLAG
ncbi:hypothetical protein Acy02nite_81780 [Actinoplanes cyaneus]|uniref:ANTAR domain-containing protein n=1 Tax=Actinoplanes cyaneus TaxID=52696 RepID=A0A919M8Y2_9ACTN|nr:ANTAR domain-containing protein [Actinoplanes cyaneus]MCW2143445.1 hypothetical protein [Actinoplanes cyaneus]GID70297.1 hypothetical protein Acy02nite_81780 [Actinoplanes cyaneus]